MVCSLRSTPIAETLEAGGGHGCDFLARAAGDVGDAITMPDHQRCYRPRLNHWLARRA